MRKLDEIDTKILAKLLADVRTPHTKIACECGISSPTVSTRIKKMKEDGLITKEFLLLELKKFGYEVVAILGINIEKIYETKISDLIRNQILTAGIDYTIGGYDLVAFVFAKQLNELDKIKYVLKKQEGVKDVDINIFNKIHFISDNIAIENSDV